jgi:hypothetical protein
MPIMTMRSSAWQEMSMCRRFTTASRLVVSTRDRAFKRFLFEDSFDQEETIDAVIATLTRTSWAIHEDRPFSDSQWNDLKGKHQTARDAAETLRTAIRTA